MNVYEPGKLYRLKNGSSKNHVPLFAATPILVPIFKEKATESDEFFWERPVLLKDCKAKTALFLYVGFIKADEVFVDLHLVVFQDLIGVILTGAELKEVKPRKRVKMTNDK